MSKEIKYKIDARRKFKKGIDELADAVRMTLGPKGRNVVLEKIGGEPQISGDGVKEILTKLLLCHIHLSRFFQETKFGFISMDL